jgi:hypothetical protein
MNIGRDSVLRVALLRIQKYNMWGMFLVVVDCPSLADSSTFQEVTFSSVYQTPTWPYKK